MKDVYQTSEVDLSKGPRVPGLFRHLYDDIIINTRINIKS